MHDLACQAGLRAGQRGTLRVALVAGTQAELARRAREAAELLPGLAPGKLAALPGIYAAERGRGRAVLLFPGESGSLTGHLGQPPASAPGTYDTDLHPAIVAASLPKLRWLTRLGLVPTGGLGHGLGEITALVWAGCLAEQDAARLVAQRAAVLAAQPGERTAMLRLDADGETAERLCARTGLVIAAYNGPRCHVLAGPAGVVRDLAGELAGEGIPATVLDSPQAFYSPAMADRVPPLRSILREFSLRPPQRTVWSTITGKKLTSGDDIPSLLCDQVVSPFRFAGPLAAAAADADLLIETGPGQSLSLLAADCCARPVLSLGGRPEEEAAAQVAAALFAASAIPSLAPLLTGRAARRIDIWRERIFIPSPCGAAAEGRAASASVPLPRAAGGTSEPASQASGAGGTAGEAGSHAGRPGGQDERAAGGQHRPAPPGGPGKGGEDQDQPASGPAHPSTAAARTGGTAAGGSDGQGAHSTDVPGLGPWFHCFREETRPAEDPVPAARTGPWRLRVLPRQPFGTIAYSLFEDDAHAGTVLTVVDDPAERGMCAMLLDAAKEATEAGGLVVISPAPGLAGLSASLHAENPGLGITLIRAPLTEAGLAEARRFAAVTSGRFRQVWLDAKGHAAEPVMVKASPEPDGTFPLGPADVILVTGMARAGDLACATALASRGAALAVIAAPGPEDPHLAACLANLRSRGGRHTAAAGG
jgi:enediyne polyketide synthase